MLASVEDQFSKGYATLRERMSVPQIRGVHQAEGSLRF